MFETASNALREGETAASGLPPAPTGDAGFWETFKATLQSNIYQGAITGRETVMEHAYDARIAAIKEATGVDLVNPFRVRDRFASQARREFADRLRTLADERPEHRAIIQPDRPIEEDMYALTRGTIAKADDLQKRYGSVTLPIVGPVSAPTLAAGAIPSDPFAMAALPAGGGAVGPGIRGVVVGGLRMGGVNAAATAAGQPWKQSWLKEAGAEYGWAHAVDEVKSAFLTGFLLDAGVRGAWRGGRAAAGYVPNLDAKGNVVGYRPKGEPAPEVVPRAADAPITQGALTDAAARLPEDNPMRRAHDGDIAAQRDVAREFGHGDDPAIKGLIDRNAARAAETDPRSTLVDDGEGMSRLAQALRREVLPENELPAGGADPVLPARHPAMADHALPRDLPAGSTFHVDGKPVGFGRVDAAKIVTDPETFQFKGGGDARGVTERLRGIEKWDPVAAGRAVIFERADGSQVVADGHQRTGLARRLEERGHEPISLDAIVFREADGWTPGDVRALAAKKNLQEGTGTVVDAAKVIRERPEIIDDSVPLGSEMMRQARALAKLDGEAFGHVVAGRIPPAYAALIGDLVPERTRHLGLVDELMAAEPSNTQQARLALNELLAVPMHVEHQMDLFGAFRIERSLMRERIKVLDRALKMLREDARVFSLLEREAGRIESAGNKLRNDVNAERALQAEAVGEVIEQLAAVRGPVSEWLNDAAREVAQGQMRPGKAAEGFSQRVRETLERDGFKGLEAPPETLRGGAGVDEPGGSQAQAQTVALESQLAGAIEDVKAADVPGQSMLDLGLADVDRVAEQASLLEVCKG